MKAKWMNRGLLYAPLYYTLCTSDKLFQKELDRLKVKDRPPFLRKVAGASTMTLTSGRKTSCIVTIRGNKKQSAAWVASVLAHEAMHIWRECREILGERSPSSEVEAYAIENITFNLMTEYLRQTR